jgi:hypothetical protein
MSEEDITPPSLEVPQHGDQGELDTGLDGHRMKQMGVPPFLTVPWQPPSRLARMLTSTVSLTIRFGPTLIVMWMIGPESLKYEIRKQARWLPYAAKYAAWWLRQEGW